MNRFKASPQKTPSTFPPSFLLPPASLFPPPKELKDEGVKREEAKREEEGLEKSLRDFEDELARNPILVVRRSDFFSYFDRFLLEEPVLVCLFKKN